MFGRIINTSTVRKQQNIRSISMSLQTRFYDEQVLSRFHDGAAAGRTDELTTIVNSGVDVDMKNDRGWTALMFAARNGQSAAAKILLQNGSDVNLINTTGQMAVDIAVFWNHQDTADILRNHAQETKTEDSQQFVNYFGHGTLNRAADKRKDTEWLEKALQSEHSRFIPFMDQMVLCVPNTNKTLPKSVRYNLYPVTCTEIGSHLASNPLIIFLGHDHDDETRAWFAVDITGMGEDKYKAWNSNIELLTSYPGGMQLRKHEASLLAQARAVLAWHDRYKFCPTCGGATVVEEAGYKRKCQNNECRSLKGIHNTSYPRVDPVVIMLVISPDGSSCLLGRQKRFPAGMWSCLAGFVEPGETIEDACRREVMEESGIKVGHVEYHSCQPWPNPSQLMIGCIGWAKTNNIKVDYDELEAAEWFSRETILQMLTRQHKDKLFVPPEQAIAHTLIKHWVKTSANL